MNKRQKVARKKHAKAQARIRRRGPVVKTCEYTHEYVRAQGYVPLDKHGDFLNDLRDSVIRSFVVLSAIKQEESQVLLELKAPVGMQGAFLYSLTEGVLNKYGFKQLGNVFAFNDF